MLGPMSGTEPPEPAGPVDRRQAALERFERVTEVPLVALALAMIPLLLVPAVVDLSPTGRTVVAVLNLVIWAAFAIELVVRITLTRDRKGFLRKEWPDVVIVLLPLLRPLRLVRSARALRLLRLGRVAGAIGFIERDGRKLLRRSKLHYALLMALVIIGLSALLVRAAENGHGGRIRGLGDSLWWAFTTVTTVGYGDAVPVTPVGRAVAALLMLTGIALFGVITANLAAFLVERGEEEVEGEIEEEMVTVSDQLAELTREVQALRAEVVALRSTRAALPPEVPAPDGAGSTSQGSHEVS